MEIQNINDTNLKEIHKYGCLYTPPNILIDYRRSAEDALVSITLRLTSLEEEDIEFQFGLCDGFDDPYQDVCTASGFTKLDTYNITNNSFLIYTFKFDGSSYFSQSENFTIAHSHNFNTNKHLRFFIMAETDKLYINSYIVSVDLFRYVLSYSGHAIIIVQDMGDWMIITIVWKNLIMANLLNIMGANYIIMDILQQNALYLDAFQEFFVVQILFV